jgi:Tfp pilus assembly protein FimV
LLDTETWEWSPADLASLLASGDADADAAAAALVSRGLTGHTVEPLAPLASWQGPGGARVAIFGGQVEGGAREASVALLRDPSQSPATAARSATPAPLAAAPLAIAPSAIAPSAAVGFAVGDVVSVAARTGPGQNKHGGVGRILAVHEPAVDDSGGGGRTYDVKYVLGGREKGVAASLICAETRAA